MLSNINSGYEIDRGLSWLKQRLPCVNSHIAISHWNLHLKCLGKPKASPHWFLGVLLILLQTDCSVSSSVGG